MGFGVPEMLICGILNIGSSNHMVITWSGCLNMTGLSSVSIITGSCMCTAPWKQTEKSTGHEKRIKNSTTNSIFKKKKASVSSSKFKRIQNSTTTIVFPHREYGQICRDQLICWSTGFNTNSGYFYHGAPPQDMRTTNWSRITYRGKNRAGTRYPERRGDAVVSQGGLYSIALVSKVHMGPDNTPTR